MGCTATICGGIDNGGGGGGGGGGGRPCQRVAKFQEQVPALKANLYDFLHDTQCPAAQMSLTRPVDEIADLIASAYVHSMFNLIESFANRDYEAVAHHQHFGFFILGEMLRYPSTIAGKAGNGDLATQNDAAVKGAALTYMSQHEMKSLPTISELPVLLAKCYVKAISEVHSSKATGNSLLLLHHCAMAFDITSEAMQCLNYYGQPSEVSGDINEGPKRTTEQVMHLATSPSIRKGNALGQATRPAQSWSVSDC